jgi:hypothetical protein
MDLLLLPAYTQNVVPTFTTRAFLPLVRMFLARLVASVLFRPQAVFVNFWPANTFVVGLAAATRAFRFFGAPARLFAGFFFLIAIVFVCICLSDAGRSRRCLVSIVGE